MDGFRIEKDRGRKGTCRVSMSGRFGASAALQLEDQLGQLLKEKAREARISLKDVSSLSRENLGVLFGMAVSFREAGGSLRLSDIPPVTEADIKVIMGQDYFERITEQ